MIALALLIGLLGLTCVLIVPALIVAWMIGELWAAQHVTPQLPEPFGLSDEEYDRLARANESFAEAAVEEVTLKEEAEGFARRQDGQLDERSRRGKALNAEISSAEAANALALDTMAELSGLPMRRWSTWARFYRNVWSLRLAAFSATSAFLFFAATGVTRVGCFSRCTT